MMRNKIYASTTTDSRAWLLLVHVVVLSAVLLLAPQQPQPCHGFAVLLGNENTMFWLSTTTTTRQQQAPTITGSTCTSSSSSSSSSRATSTTTTRLYFFLADKENSNNDKQPDTTDSTKQTKNKVNNNNNNNKAAVVLATANKKSKQQKAVLSLPTTTMERYKKNQRRTLSSFGFNPMYGLAWIALVAFAFGDDFAPGALGAREDAQLFQAILDNPMHPDGVNELFYCLFNLFAVIPVLLANIYIPAAATVQAAATRRDGTSQEWRLPAWPFILASSVIGYFALGIYLTLVRPPPVDENEINQQQLQLYDSTNDTMSWFVQNILENKAINWAVVAFTLYLPFGSHVVEQLRLLDPPVAQQQLWQGFVQLETSSRVAAISTLDLFLLYISAVAGTGRDYRLRRQQQQQQQRGRNDAAATAATTTTTPVTDTEVAQVVAASALVPILGTAIYCAVRPSLVVLPKMSSLPTTASKASGCNNKYLKK
jgi:hypothetical protein